MGNYDKMAQMAADIFLAQDQGTLLVRYPLAHDDQWIYVCYLGHGCRICRRDGFVFFCEGEGASIGEGEGSGAGENGAMSAPEPAPAPAPATATIPAPACTPVSPRAALAILDMVCNTAGAPRATGEWRTVQQLSGAVSAPATASLFEKSTAQFAGRVPELSRALAGMGALVPSSADASYVVDVFPGFPVWIQFWDADDEFPAQMTFLWDASAAVHLHFETLWYVMFDIVDEIAARMGLLPDSVSAALGGAHE